MLEYGNLWCIRVLESKVCRGNTYVDNDDLVEEKGILIMGNKNMSLYSKELSVFVNSNSIWVLLIAFVITTPFG